MRQLVIFALLLGESMLWAQSIDLKRRVSTLEMVSLPVLAAANIWLLDASSPSRAGWKGGVLFDDVGRDFLALGSKRARTASATASDFLLIGVASVPLVYDSLYQVGWKNSDRDTATQMLVISMQSFLLSGVLIQATKGLVARERPYARECGVNPNYSDNCGSVDSRKSFFSGHAGIAFTGAGLVCQHRQSGFSQDRLCAASLGAATLVSLGRVMSDKHYLSDVLFGGIVGWVSGYYLPRWFHYSDTLVMGKLYPDGGGVDMVWSF